MTIQRRERIVTVLWVLAWCLLYFVTYGLHRKNSINSHKVNIHQQGGKLRQSHSSYRLDSVNEIGKESQQKQNTKGMVNSQALPSTSRIFLRHGSCHEAVGAVRWTHVQILMEDAEQTQTWKKNIGLTHLLVLLTNTDWSVVRTKTELLSSSTRRPHTLKFKSH